MDLSDARPRLPALTSLRFFAAFHVVIFHFQAMQIFIGPAWFQKLSSIGYVGVSFFFVLSGFILVYTYAGRPIVLNNFWRARFARIYPSYAFSLLVTAPFFFYAVLTMNIPFFVWAKAHLKLASALVLSLLQAGCHRQLLHGTRSPGACPSKPFSTFCFRSCCWSSFAARSRSCCS